MLHLDTPCIFSFRAGARRCSILRIPCRRSFGAGARRCPIRRIPCTFSFGACGRTCLPFALLLSCSPLAPPPLQSLRQPSSCQEIPDTSLPSSHQGRSAATASAFAAFHAQGYHSCSCPAPSSDPCAVVSSLHHYRLALLVSATIRSFGAVHSPL